VISSKQCLVGITAICTLKLSIFTMIDELKNYISQNQLFEKNDKLLVTVSGGLDSIVLCNLLKKLNYSIAIAHCNFQLRGKESDDDEQFVADYALKLGIPIHKKRFNTEGYALENKLGTQEAARDLRYQWFEELTQLFDYQYIITAHHATDNIETVLFNFSNGAGLRGMKGILPKNKKIVRPLLWAKKSDITAYAKSEGIEYREDSSNSTEKYTRNYIRHKILPEFKNLNPNFENTASENIQRFKEAHDLLDYFIENVKKDITQTIDNQYFIDKNKLNAYPSVSTLLFEILRNYGFNNSQVEDILWKNDFLPKIGTKFYSANFELLIDRDFYILREKKDKNTEGPPSSFFLINQDDLGLDFNQSSIKISHFFAPNIELEKSDNTAQFDFDTLSFPLKLRRWQIGDFFHPLGMKGKKQKLSDYFTQKKISDFDKEKIWILETEKREICWIVEHRMDDRFKIKSDTKHCFSMNYTL
jgi:tRNA(Ile)-lysidine synthase